MESETPPLPPLGSDDLIQTQSHRVLAIPELIRNIFQYSGNSDCASGAIVNKEIGAIALDVLWREMDSIIPLLNILSPLWPEGLPSIWTFHNDTNPLNWARFQEYARRVRVLAHDDGPEVPDGSLNVLSQEVITQLTLCKPANVGALLPNLKAIDWIVRSNASTLWHLIPFISPSVKHLVIREEFPCGTPLIARFLDGLSNIPDIRFIEFHLSTRPKSDASGCIPSLARFLANQDQLLAATLPSFRPSEHRSISDIVKAPHKLECLDLVLVAGQSEECINFLKTLPGLCSNLKEIGVDFLKRENTPFTLTFDCILPLLEIHTLETVEILSDQGMTLDEAQIRQMGKAWPRLCRLALWPDGFQMNKVGLPPSALWWFAPSFPVLEDLAVYIHLGGQHPPLPHLQPPPQYPWRAFGPNFRTLNIGGSRLPNQSVNPMAEFLSTVTQSPINLTFDGDGESGVENRDYYQWRKVREAYEMLMRIRGGVATNAQLYINALAGDNEALRQRL
ncbi:hypothetical protein FS837_006784, partial [Tulasnella sp. UAMH 9824]